jgi:LysR family transcriptional activator of nhaA
LQKTRKWMRAEAAFAGKNQLGFGVLVGGRLYFLSQSFADRSRTFNFARKRAELIGIHRCRNTLQPDFSEQGFKNRLFAVLVRKKNALAMKTVGGAKGHGDNIATFVISVKHIKCLKLIYSTAKVAGVDWLNYHHLYYFWTVAKEQSFTKAALRLGIAQSAVSFQVAQLEDYLGKKLLLRSTSKKLTLTEEGQTVFIQAEEIFRQGKELVDGLKDGGIQSTLRLGAIGSLSKNLQIRLLRPVIDRADFEISVDVGDAQTLLSRLQSYNLDGILCDVPYPYSEDIPLIQREIAREPICLIARKSKQNLPLQVRLAKYGIYLPARSNPMTSEIESFLKSQKQQIMIKGYIDDIALLRLLAIETESVVAIPRIGAARELQNNTIVLQHQFRTMSQKFYLVLRQNGSRSEKIRELLNQV